MLRSAERPRDSATLTTRKAASNTAWTSSVGRRAVGNKRGRPRPHSANRRGRLDISPTDGLPSIRTDIHALVSYDWDIASVSTFGWTHVAGPCYPGATQGQNGNGLRECKPLFAWVAGARNASYQHRHIKHLAPC